jgi:hypothetical protein
LSEPTLETAAIALDNMAILQEVRRNPGLAQELRDVAAFVRLWAPVVAAAERQAVLAAGLDEWHPSWLVATKDTEAAVRTAQKGQVSS